jgi:hypothetical protein
LVHGRIHKLILSASSILKDIVWSFLLGEEGNRRFRLNLINRWIEYVYRLLRGTKVLYLHVFFRSVFTAKAQLGSAHCAARHTRGNNRYLRDRRIGVPVVVSFSPKLNGDVVVARTHLVVVHRGLGPDFGIKTTRYCILS